MKIHQTEIGLKYKLNFIYFFFPVSSKLAFGKSAIKFPFIPLDKALVWTSTKILAKGFSAQWYYEGK